MTEPASVLVVGRCPDCDFTQNVTVDPGHVAVVTHGYGHTITSEVQFFDDPTLVCRFCGGLQQADDCGTVVDSLGPCHWNCLTAARSIYQQGAEKP